MAISVTSQEKEILSNVSIPPRPQALLKIAQEAKKTEPNVKFIAETISEDAAIAAAVLQVVNSAAFARINKINSIQQAVMILGIKRIFPLVKAVALKSALPANNNLREFWQSSSLVASACMLFCQALNKPELTDNAYREPRYKEWLIAFTQAEKDFTLSKDYYNNLIALKDMRITEESSARYLINKK